MIIVGRVEAGNSYTFTLAISGVKSRIDIYSQTSIIDSVSTLPDHMLIRPGKSVEPWLLASACMIGKGNFTKVYGKEDIIHQFTYLLTRANLLRSLMSGTLATGEYVEKGVRLNVIANISTYNTTAPIRGLAYKTINKISASSQELTTALRASKVKTYEEIISSRDMSWYFNDDGSCKKDYQLITTLDGVKEVNKKLLAAGRLIAIDTETTGTDFYEYEGHAEKRPLIASISLSWDDNQGVDIVFYSNMMSTVDFHETMHILYPTLCNKELCYANAIFDFTVLYANGYKLPIAHDVILMEFNLDSSVVKNTKGLKNITRKYFSAETIELDDILGTNFIAKNVLDIDPELHKVYSCSDSDYTLKCTKLLLPYAGKMTSYKLDVQLCEILAIAQYNGAPVNKKLLEELSSVNANDVETVKSLMYQYLYKLGPQMIAYQTIIDTRGEDYNPTEEEVSELACNKDFLIAIEPMLHKQGKKYQGKNVEINWNTSQDAAYVLYDIFRYPQPEEGRSTSADVLEYLLKEKTTTPSKFLSKDVESYITKTRIPRTAGEDILIHKSDLDSYKYPLVYLLSLYRNLAKLQSSFFEPMINDSDLNRYYTKNSMISADTARIINPIQTLVKSLKQLVVPRESDWYLIVFDAAQIEFRVMLGMANNYWNALLKKNKLNPDAQTQAIQRSLQGLINNLNNPENDVHREGGAIFAGVEPDNMTKEQRSEIKAVHFSVPYGAGAYSIAETKLKRAPEEEWQEIINQTEAILSSWRNHMFPLYHFLEYKRDTALIPTTDLPPKVSGAYGKVTNPLGRYKLFKLDELTPKKIASIRRQAGNYPIQSFARELFFTAILRLYKRLKKEGYIVDNNDLSKVILNLFVHDECVLQVHKSIHPYEMYKYIYESCFLHIDGHPTYFMGIAIANNWLQGKKDEYEAPVAFVQEKIKDYQANPDRYKVPENADLNTIDYKQQVFDDISYYFANRVMSEIVTIQKNTANPLIIDPVYFLKHFRNYFVKPRLPLYNKPIRSSSYAADNRIPKEEYALFKQLDYYIYITGNADKYSLVFEDQIVPYSQVILVEMELSENEAIGSEDEEFNIDFGLSELEEDYLEKEETFRKEFYVCEDASIENIRARQQRSNEYVEKATEIFHWFFDFENRLVFDISCLNKAQFNLLTTYLKQYVDSKGTALYWLTSGRLCPAHVKLIAKFDNSKINTIYESKTNAEHKSGSDGKHELQKNETTSLF